MSVDTPETVNTAAAFLRDLTLLPDVLRMGAINDLNSTAQMLTRYAESLERDKARIRELEAKEFALKHAIDDLQVQHAAHKKVCAEMRSLLVRYRTETPLGHQPHMIAHVVDALLETKQPEEEEQS